MPVEINHAQGAAWHLAGEGELVSFDRVPFAPDSLYNQSFAEKYGSNAAVPIHPQSDLQIASLRRSFNFDTGELNTGADTQPFRFTGNVEQYTMPVYIVTIDTPLATVRYSGVGGESSESSTVVDDGGGTFENVPVDPAWKPSPPLYPADYFSDAQIIIWDRDNILGHVEGSQHWDFWRCRGNPDGTWATNGVGEYLAVNGSHFIGTNDSTGIPANTPSPYPSRGAGVPYITGLVRPWELEAAAVVEGTLGHALAFAYSSPAGVYAPPASKSDGVGYSAGEAGAGWPFSGPEGMFLKLNEDFDIASLNDPYTRVLARTARDYGMVCIDNSGRPKIYMEADVSANGMSGWNVVPSENVFSPIPLEAFHVVDYAGGNTVRSEADVGWGTGVEEWCAGLTGGIVGTPAILGTAAGTAAAGGATMLSASQTPLVNELLLAVWSEFALESTHVSDITGNGLTLGWDAGEYRPYIKRGVYTTGNRNCVGGVMAARAPASPTVGAVTMTTTGTGRKVIQALRVTANAKPIRVVSRDSELERSQVPSVTIKAPASGNLLLGIVLHGRMSTCGAADGWTSNVLDSGTTDGAGMHISTFTRTASGADVTLAPALTAATEWIAMIVEIT